MDCTRWSWPRRRGSSTRRYVASSPLEIVSNNDLAVRVEWAKARARSERWNEEVNIITEEMRRVLRYLGWRAEHWQGLAEFDADLDPAGRAGVRAYALRQANLVRRLRAAFRATWSSGSAKSVLGGDLGAVLEEGVHSG